MGDDSDEPMSELSAHHQLSLIAHHSTNMNVMCITHVRSLWNLLMSNSARRSLWHTLPTDIFAKRLHMNELVYKSDDTCIEQLRMDRNTFQLLCRLLESDGGLCVTQNMLVDEQVAMFLHILAHHVKNRVIKFNFQRSGETVSRHFRRVLAAVLRLHPRLLQQPPPINDSCPDERWHHFQNCLGALDGTHIRVRVPANDRSRYRTRKGEIAQNVLAACSVDEKFTYVLAGWEGSAADGRVLRDALSTGRGLRVPNGTYYLVDAGFANAPGFLAPYRGQRYHLSEWRDSQRPTTPAEYFNYKHASARNVIERCFGQLKARWAILRSPSFYPVNVQTNIILACCMLHNFIKCAMSNDHVTDPTFVAPDRPMEVNDHITSVVTSDEWTSFRDNLASAMFAGYRPTPP